MTSSKFAHLYLGTDRALTPVFRDLEPGGYRFPDGTVVAWPDGSRFAVWFPVTRFPYLCWWSGHEKGYLAFYGDDSLPMGFKPRDQGPLTATSISILHDFPFRDPARMDWDLLRADPRLYRRMECQATVTLTLLDAVHG